MPGAGALGLRERVCTDKEALIQLLVGGREWVCMGKEALIQLGVSAREWVCMDKEVSIQLGVSAGERVWARGVHSAGSGCGNGLHADGRALETKSRLGVIARVLRSRCIVRGTTRFSPYRRGAREYSQRCR